jgi:hypothetical protein
VVVCRIIVNGQPLIKQAQTIQKFQGGVAKHPSQKIEAVSTKKVLAASAFCFKI